MARIQQSWLRNPLFMIFTMSGKCSFQSSVLWMSHRSSWAFIILICGWQTSWTSALSLLMLELGLAKHEGSNRLPSLPIQYQPEKDPVWPFYNAKYFYVTGVCVTLCCCNILDIRSHKLCQAMLWLLRSVHCKTKLRMCYIVMTLGFNTVQ